MSRPCASAKSDAWCKPGSKPHRDATSSPRASACTTHQPARLRRWSPCASDAREPSPKASPSKWPSSGRLSQRTRRERDGPITQGRGSGTRPCLQRAQS
eukprot:3828432-Pyramimonas_sp.AAC.1